MLNESIALGAGDLLAMLIGDEDEDSNDDAGLEEEEVDEEEERDIVTALDGQFAGAIDPSKDVEVGPNKRKREEPQGAFKRVPFLFFMPQPATTAVVLP